MAYNFLQSVRLLADAAVSFADHCVVGIERRLHNIELGVELADAGNGIPADEFDAIVVAARMLGPDPA